MRRLLLATLLVPLALSLGPDRSRAEQPPGQPDDFYWAFAPRGPFADQRVVDAFSLLIDTTGVPQAAAVDGALIYGDQHVIDFDNEQSIDEALKLLAAAGLSDPAHDLIPARPCRFWTPSDTEAPVAQALGHALVDTLSGLGIDAAPCEATSDSDQADFYVWSFGQDLPITQGQPDLFGDTFLQIADLQGASPAGPGVTNVSPPATGDAGLR